MTPSRLRTLLIGICLLLCGFCTIQWVREARLRQELTDDAQAHALLEKHVFEAEKLASSYASEIRQLEARVAELKQSEGRAKADSLKAATALHAAEAELRQAQVNLVAARSAIEQQNVSIRKQNEALALQNEAIRQQNENLKKLVSDRNELVRLLNERTDMLNKLNVEKVGK